MRRAATSSLSRHAPSEREAGRDGPGREWGWLAALLLGVALLAALPYVLAYAQASHGLAFAGMFWSPHDFAQYGAAMREGAAGSWLIHDHLTGEPHRPAFMYPLYVALGRMASLLRLDLQLAYHAVELISRGILLVSLYLFCRAALEKAIQRRLAFSLIALSTGFELALPETSTFVTLFTAPHLMLGLAFLLLSAWLYLLSWSTGRLRHAAGAGITVLGLGLTNPFSLVSLCAVIAAHLGFMGLRRAVVPRGALLSAGAIFLAAAPFLAYNLLAFTMDPFWGTVYGAQNVTPSQTVPELALRLGPLLVLAAFGLPAFLRGLTPARWLILTWIVVSLALMYAPVGFQRRFALGLHPMLGVVAATGLPTIWQWVRCHRRLPFAVDRFVLTAALLQILVTPSLFLYLALLRTASFGAAADTTGVFHPMAVKEAGLWLQASMNPEDVVLGETGTSNYIAGIIPGRVFVGHWSATLNYAAKEAAMRGFYAGDEGAQSSQGFLAENGIRYVLYGPRERMLGGQFLEDAPYLRPVYVGGSVDIYKVHREIIGEEAGQTPAGSDVDQGISG